MKFLLHWIRAKGNFYIFGELNISDKTNCISLSAVL
jgi:hypothetical protein